jgi:alanine-glyoxylate transaminase/serine-glyoxylate transaminase/serine-pyruvate transaminase
MLTSVSVPNDVDEATVRSQLLHNYNIEIGGGLGAFKGKAWRIGLMGETCRKENVISLLTALGEILPKKSTNEAIQTAERVYNTH